MRPPGLSHAGYQAWLDAQTSTHQQRVRVRVMNLDHRVLHELTNRVVDGDVTIDVTRDPITKLSLTLADPSRSIGWEPDGPSGVPRYGNRMIRADVLTQVPALGEWVEVPVFTGPVVDFDRTGAEVNIACDDKSRLAMGSFPHPKTYRRKTKVTWVIRNMLAMTGEIYLGQLPDLRDTLPEDLTVTRWDSPLIEAQELAASIDRVLFWDALGRVRLVERPRAPIVTVPPEWLTGPVAVDRQNVAETVNRWIVLGPKPKGGKKRVSADVRAYSLAPVRNGERIWRMERIERNGIKTRKRARQIGNRKRDAALRRETAFTIDCLNLPHLSPYDLVRVRDPYMGPFRVRVQKASIPLDGSPMVIGSVTRRRTTGKRAA